MIGEFFSRAIEIIGALGVMASILFLSLQIRQYTTATRSATLQALTNRVHDRLLLVPSNPELAQLISSDWTGELDEVQRTQLFYWLSAAIVDVKDIYNQYRMGIIPADFLESRMRIFRRNLFQSPPAQHVWQNMRGAYEDDFILWFEQQIAQGAVERDGW